MGNTEAREDRHFVYRAGEPEPRREVGTGLPYPSARHLKVVMQEEKELIRTPAAKKVERQLSPEKIERIVWFC